MGFFSGVRAEEASARRHKWATKRDRRSFRVPAHLPAAEVDEELRGLQRSDSAEAKARTGTGKEGAETNRQSSAPRASGGVLGACARCHSPIGDARPGELVYCLYCKLVSNGGRPLGQSELRGVNARSA